MDLKKINTEIQQQVRGLESGIQKLKGGDLDQLAYVLDDLQIQISDFELWIVRNEKEWKEKGE